MHKPNHENHETLKNLRPSGGPALQARQRRLTPSPGAQDARGPQIDIVADATSGLPCVQNIAEFAGCIRVWMRDKWRSH